MACGQGYGMQPFLWGHRIWSCHKVPPGLKHMDYMVTVGTSFPFWKLSSSSDTLGLVFFLSFFETSNIIMTWVVLESVCPWGPSKKYWIGISGLEPRNQSFYKSCINLWLLHTKFEILPWYIWAPPSTPSGATQRFTLHHHVLSLEAASPLGL